MERKPGNYDIKRFNTGRSVLYIENDSCSVNIKEIERRSIEVYENSVYESSVLRVDCEFIPLKTLISLTLNVDTASLCFEDNRLVKKYYSAFVEQKTSNEKQDSIIRNRIIDALGLYVEKEFISVDTTFISSKDKSKYLEYYSEPKDEMKSSCQLTSASLPDGSKRISGSMTFNNYKLSDVISKIGEELDKTLVINTDENETITYNIKFSGWEALKEKLETDLGLDFNTYSTQRKIYSVKIKN
ncbi:MAG: hypothetical protein ACOC2E_02800 [Bacteroidota bacterium]